MHFKEFIKRKRLDLGLSQSNLAKELSKRGQETSAARVGHWETGRNKPPLEDPRFREALSAILQMDSNQLMAELGYVIDEDERSPEALLAASIVDHLPRDAQQLALDYLKVLEKRFAETQ